MNRRQLIKQSIQALLGLGAVVTGVKASANQSSRLVIGQQGPEVIHVFVTPDSGKEFQDAVIKTLTDDIRRNGPIREAMSSF